MVIPEGVYLEVYDPDGRLIADMDLSEYDISQPSANRVGDNVIEAVQRWMEREDK